MKNRILSILFFSILFSKYTFSQANFYDKEIKQYGLINSNGKVIYEAKSQNRIDLLNGYAKIVENTRHGLIDSLGNIIIEPQYEWVYPYSDGLIGVVKIGQTGFVNLKNELVIPFNYDEACIFCDSIAWVLQGSVYGFIDIEGNEITPTIYEDIYPSYNDTAFAFKNGIRYHITKEGIVGKDNVQNTHPLGVMKTTYSCPKYLLPKDEVVQKYDKEKGEMSFYNKSNQLLFKKKLYRCYPFQNGFSFFELEKDGGFGMMNIKGEVIASPNKKWTWVYDGGINNGIAIIETKTDDNNIEFVYVNSKSEVIYKGSYFIPKSEDSY